VNQPRVLTTTPAATARTRFHAGQFLCHLWLMVWEAVALTSAVLILTAAFGILPELDSGMHLAFVEGSAVGFAYVVSGGVLFFTSSVYYLLDRPGLARIAQYTSMAMLLLPPFVLVLGGFLLHVLGGVVGVVGVVGTMLGFE
jgi:hypothetical protein